MYINIYEKKYFLGAIAVLIAFLAVFYFVFAGAPQANSSLEQFVVPLTATSSSVANLKSSGFIKSTLAFDIALSFHGRASVAAGGYMISKSMNVWQVAGVFTAKPALLWVVIPPGLRKEQIADILQKNLDWTDAEKTEWISVDTTSNPDYIEGVYF